MAFTSGRLLSAREVAALSEPGKHAVGRSLFLQITPAGARSWSFRFSRGGKMREFGLGPYPLVSLSMAQKGADHVRLQVRQGIDPIAERKSHREAAAAQARAQDEIFSVVAEAHIRQQSPAWKNPKSAAQWRSSLRAYVFPSIGAKPCREITSADVLGILRPIWNTKTVTAGRLRQRIEAVWDSAKAQGLCTGDNPARLRGNLDRVLPASRKVHKVKNHAALPAALLPAVMGRLGAASNGVAALAVQYLVVTAARPSEVTQATRGEIDLKTRVWSIPAQRMKAGKPHRVPLSRKAVVLLRSLLPPGSMSDPSALVFPGQRTGQSLSLTALSKALRRALRGVTADHATVHGLRSTFADWCAEQGESPELRELALAHAPGNGDGNARGQADTILAYRRSDLLDQRRPLMQRWATYACGAKTARKVRPRR